MRLRSLVAPIAAALLCALLAPAVVNGDGLGYLKASPTGIVVPGHLGYLPLLRFLGRIFGRPESLELLGPARGLSIAACAVAVAALQAVARRLSGERAELTAGLGLAFSFGALQAGSDVESYAPALAAVCVAAWCAVRRRTGGGAIWTAGAAVATAGAALLHVENVLLAPAIALICARRRIFARSVSLLIPSPFDGILVLLGSGGLVLVAYLGAFKGRGDDLHSAVEWVVKAGHGFSYPLRASTPLVALYGMAKTLVYAPYPYQASWARVIGQSAAGGVAMAAMGWLALKPGGRPALPRFAQVAWIAPYAIVGVAFFASDNERWIFLLPPVWLAVAAGAAAEERAGRVARGLLAGLLLCDVALGVPLARENEMRERADRLTEQVLPHDLVISPGHSWDEYIGFYRAVPLDHFPMIYFCGLLGGREAMRAELAHRVVDARARGSRVFLARVDEPEGADGWKELVLFGITPSNVDELLPAGRRVSVAPGLVRLDP